METVKVDIQKLQTLNDRINQTIDALSQLRQSVHAYQPTVGLQHTAQSFLPQQQLGFGYNVPTQFPQQIGLQHTPFIVPQQQAMGYNVQAQYPQQIGLQHTPFIMPQQQAMGYNVQNWPYAQMGWVGPVGGLSHTSLAPVDASLRRLTQMFPFALSPVPIA